MKDLSAFNNNKSKSDGLQSYCRACSKQTVLDWQDRNPDRRRESQRRWNKVSPKYKVKRLKVRQAYQIEQYGRTFTKEEISLMTKDRFRAARALGYRSGLEVRITRELDEQGITYQYEEHTIRYRQPEEERRYTPDLILPNGIVIELKGQWATADRKKIKLVKEQFPNLDLRMVFNNAHAKISKKSKTTYADICTKLKIPFASKSVPTAWTKEAPYETRTRALEEACGKV